mmetsp:Transcript_30015/g.97729  ORF Transcript_30015/g.97729 Transcript_30015/m.97729 type:complete len:211 (-) Transcript_30015:2394-3026(-)
MSFGTCATLACLGAMPTRSSSRPRAVCSSPGSLTAPPHSCAPQRKGFLPTTRARARAARSGSSAKGRTSRTKSRARARICGSSSRRPRSSQGWCTCRCTTPLRAGLSTRSSTTSAEVCITWTRGGNSSRRRSSTPSALDGDDYDTPCPPPPQSYTHSRDKHFIRDIVKRQDRYRTKICVRGKDARVGPYHWKRSRTTSCSCRSFATLCRR